MDTSREETGLCQPSNQIKAALIKNSVYITDTVYLIEQKIEGRMASKNGNTAILCATVIDAGDGDHLEIGTMHGGSAIMIALVKKQMGISGMVYCIDPLNGYYRDGTICRNPGAGSLFDPISGVEISLSVFDRNIRQFGVAERIKMIAQKSDPWPSELNDKSFVTAYIDGDHWNGIPLKDWNNIKGRVRRYVIFDDCSGLNIMPACKAAANDPEWREVFRGNNVYVVEKECHNV